MLGERNPMPVLSLISAASFVALPLVFLAGVWLKYRALVKRMAGLKIDGQDLRILVIFATAAALIAFPAGWGLHRILVCHN